MILQKGDVVLVPFPYTDLSATKTRPAVVVSSDFYHAVRPEILLAYLSSSLSRADPRLDYILRDWQESGLLKPTFMRPKIAAVEPSLIVYHVGKLSKRDMQEVNRRLRLALALS